MIQYTTYTFYINIYKGNMPETDFNRLVTKASAEVCRNIFNRDITGYEDEVQMATCSVTDILLKIEKSEQRKDVLINSDTKIVSSQSVGDLHQTFANVNNLNDLNNEISNLKKEIGEKIRMYLLHTNLLYRGV